jgi:hypothetical protein
MTFQIAKSVLNALPYSYADEVEKFRQAKLAHRFTGDIAPSAPAIIEHAVRRIPRDGEADDFAADYEVIDDVPVPTLAERKAVLLGKIRIAEAAAMARIISPGRERLMGFDLNAVYAKPEAARGDADRALLAKSTDVATRKQAILRHGAALEVEVEDLAEVAIGGWTLRPFPDAAA